MRKLKEVLRLHSLGLSQHQIARSCSISQSTVQGYVSAAQAAGVKWPLPDNWDDQQIEQAGRRQACGLRSCRFGPVEIQNI
jgi:predicted transcriptional regulator